MTIISGSGNVGEIELYVLDSGIATGGTSTTLVDNTKDWGTDVWKTTLIRVINGTNIEIRSIGGNSGNEITVDTSFTTTPTTSTKYDIIGFSKQSGGGISGGFDSANDVYKVSGYNNGTAINLATEDGNLASIESKIDVSLSSLATEATLNAIKSALSSVGTDKIQTVPDNPSNLDVALSTIATEATLLAIKAALSSVGTDRLLTTPDNPQNLDVALSTIRDLFTPISGSDSITAGNNTSGVSTSLDIGGRPTVEVYYNVSGAATINIYGSTDGSTWRHTSAITIPAAEENAVIFSNGYKYVKAECITTGIDVTLEISASR